MSSLQILEQRLTHEMPGFAWSCRPAASATVLPNTQIPEEIEVTATRRGDGKPAAAPWLLNGNMLFRWGINATASLICNLYPRELAKDHLAPGWDKLAEV